MTFAPLQYDFLSPRRIVFGWGRRSELGQSARDLGRRALLLVGSRTLADNGVIDELRQNLFDAGIAVVPIAEIDREPHVEDVDRAAEVLRAAGAGDGDFCLAIGGGSTIDLAKGAVAVG